jgi:3'(2'),5'-bisphosphate nucleotidase
MIKAYAREHEALLPAVREAGRAVLRFFTEKTYAVRHKDAENPVTDADFAANRILRSALTNLYPGDAILSEESDSDAEREAMQSQRLEKKRVWIIDPIDGTREFITGRPEFAVSIGLVENGAAVLGFVFNPARDYLLSGGASLGLFRNGTPFAAPVKNLRQGEAPNIVVSRSEQKNGHLKHLEKFYSDLTERTVGSIAYKLALVADGTYDLAISVKPKNEWDIAGGAALLAAVGFELYEGNFMPVTFNKPQTESEGLVAGSAPACAWYKSITSSS